MAIHRFGKLVGLSLVVLLLMTSPAEAQKLGDVVKNLTTSMSNLPFVLSSVAYIMGLFFAIWGVFKFKDHVDNPSQNPLSAGVKRFLAGGLLFSGPTMAKVLRSSLFAGSGPGLANTGHTAATGTGMDKMIVDFVANIYGPISILLLSFTYIAGIALLLNGIIRLTKTAQEGPRGPTGMGTIMTFLAAGAMFSFGDMMGSFSTSLFGDAQVMTIAQIGPSVISEAADRDKVASVIEAVMAFVTIVGFIAFIRGWFVLKAFADGHNNYTLAQGLTFLFGGVLAINLGELVNVLQNTLGIAPGSGITFGS
jgi:intracellular multiplication protein IcmC